MDGVDIDRRRIYEGNRENEGFDEQGGVGEAEKNSKRGGRKS